MNLLFYQFEINRSTLVFVKHTHNYVGFPICHSYSSMPLAPYSRFVFQTKDFRIKAGNNYINIETSILMCLSCTIASLFPHPWPGLFVLNIVIKTVSSSMQFGHLDPRKLFTAGSLGSSVHCLIQERILPIS